MATLPPRQQGNQSIVVPGLSLTVMSAPRRRPMAPPPTELNRTLYIRNLNEKISLKTIKTSLEAIFTTFGKILDLRASKNVKMRGQAFVTFENQESATKALNEAQGFPLFSLPMDIQYARDTNYIFAEQNGTLEQQKKRRAEEKARKALEPKKPKLEASLGSTGWFPGGAPMPAEFLPPNSTLFIENLPPETTQQILNDLFNQFPGFKEVRIVPGKSDIAFVEYDTEAQSTYAKQQLNLYKITPDREIKHRSARWDLTLSEPIPSRFTVQFLVCDNQAFECDVIFDPGDPMYPPDLILPDLDVELAELDALVNWRGDDPANLASVMASLRRIYQRQQRGRLEDLGVEKINFDLGCLQHHDVYFAFTLPLAAEEPHMDVDDAFKDVRARCKITYEVSNQQVRRITPTIDFTSTLFPNDQFRVPKFSIDVPIIEYIIEVQEEISRVLTDARSAGSKKERLISGLIEEFRKNCLEYDDIHHTFASFFFEVPIPGEKDPASAVVNLHLADGATPKIIMSSTIFTKSDGHTPETKELSARLDMTMSVDSFIGRFRVSILEQIPLMHESLQKKRLRK
ncbi:U2 small nuclear ribonucleoprotein B'' [Irineochytrium annulatum]|nr:U2 small nuclear ribonucleoprotein B'' [Irineochytrium annulatum]